LLENNLKNIGDSFTYTIYTNINEEYITKLIRSLKKNYSCI